MNLLPVALQDALDALKVVDEAMHLYPQLAEAIRRWGEEGSSGPIAPYVTQRLDAAKADLDRA